MTATNKILNNFFKKYMHEIHNVEDCAQESIKKLTHWLRAPHTLFYFPKISNTYNQRRIILFSTKRIKTINNYPKSESIIRVELREKDSSVNLAQKTTLLGHGMSNLSVRNQVNLHTARKLLHFKLNPS